MSGETQSRKAIKRKKKQRDTRRIALIGAPALLLIVLAVALLPRLAREDVPASVPLPTPAATAAAAPPDATREPAAAPTAPPAPTQAAAPGAREAGEPYKAASTQRKALNFRQRRYSGKAAAQDYQREPPIAMGAPDSYAALEGVTTFRGNNYRDNSAWGFVPDNAGKLTLKWSVPVSGLDDWNGVGWTGQAAIVRWPDDVLQQMNVSAAKKKGPLTEVIIAALDGKIRFIDLMDGKRTRPEIDIGAPIKGSVTVDPRGYPLLYCGQGIFEVHGRTVKCGMRIFSLISGKPLWFLNGDDKHKLRNWYCFDAAPLIDAQTDTMLQVGENGLTYLVKLNAEYDREMGKVRVKPQVDRYGYKSNVTKRPGMENSIAVYNHYGYFVDNSGLLICLDLNTLKAIWATPTGDDTDATCAIEEDEEGVWLYTANEMDLRADAGNIQMRCYDALTGKQRWKAEAHVSNRTLAGAFASPAIGKGALGDIVFFNIAKTSQGGTLFALDKQTGKAIWKRGLGPYSWSTPALLYDKAGRGYVLIGNSGGTLRLLDGLSGETLSELELENNIEGSPSVFDNMAVVSTRGGQILGVEIS